MSTASNTVTASNPLAALTAGPWTVDAGHSHIGFAVRHLVIAKVRGQFTEFTGTITVADDVLQSKVEATVVANSIDTRDEGRDGHLRGTDFFDIELQYVDFVADIHGAYHDLRGARDRRARACLDPASYERSQALAIDLVEAGSLGVVYPAVRHPGGQAVACFRPAAVGHVRRGARYRFTWTRDRVAVVRRLPTR